MIQTMKSVVIDRHGGPEVLSLVERALPVPRQDEVRIAVRTVGVAFADVYARRGIDLSAPSLPHTPGFDVVGTVHAVGSAVHDLHVGMRVAAIVARGGSAEFVCARAERVVPVPHQVSDEAAVAVLLNYVTVLQMLVRVGRIRAGQAVFAHALAGGVGSALLDLARLLGLRVVGTVSSGKHALVQQLGGHPIDYRSADFVEQALAIAPAGFAVVLDGIGGRTLTRSHRLVAAGGCLIGFGFQSATSSAHRLAMLPTLARIAWLALWPGQRTRLYTIMGFNRPHPDWMRSDIAFVLERLARGELSPLIAAVLPLSDIARAHAMLEAGEVRGKLVLRVAG